MVRRLWILCFLVALVAVVGTALWLRPWEWREVPALAESAALSEARNQYRVLLQQRRFTEAEPFAAEALRLAENEFGPNHPRTATLLENLTGLYYAQGRYAEAEPLIKRILKIRGPDDPRFAMHLDSLSKLKLTQGRYAEAEPLHKQDHPAFPFLVAPRRGRGVGGVIDTKSLKFYVSGFRLPSTAPLTTG